MATMWNHSFSTWLGHSANQRLVDILILIWTKWSRIMTSHKRHGVWNGRPNMRIVTLCQKSHSLSELTGNLTWTRSLTWHYHEYYSKTKITETHLISGLNRDLISYGVVAWCMRRSFTTRQWRTCDITTNPRHRRWVTCPIQVTQIAKFMGPTWGPPGSYRPQMGPMLAPWTLVAGKF